MSVPTAEPLQLDATPPAAPSDPHANTPADRARHRDMLVIASLVLLLAPLLSIRPDQRLALPGWSSLPLPSTCMSQELFHARCPGCGLTRSIILLAHGHWTASFHMHHVGWLMALSIAAQFPYRIACLRTGRMVLGRKIPRWFGHTLIFVLVADWLVVLVYG
jgi:hypothetical protein